MCAPLTARTGSLPVVQDRRWILPVAAAIVRRPSFWGSALRASLRLAPRGWWRAWPPIPMPPSAYLRFRVQTNDGAPDARPQADEVLAYLRWCRDNRHVLGAARPVSIHRPNFGTSE